MIKQYTLFILNWSKLVENSFKVSLRYFNWSEIIIAIRVDASTKPDIMQDKIIFVTVFVLSCSSLLFLKSKMSYWKQIFNLLRSERVFAFLLVLLQTPSNNNNSNFPRLIFGYFLIDFDFYFLEFIDKAVLINKCSKSNRPVDTDAPSYCSPEPSCFKLFYDVCLSLYISTTKVADDYRKLSSDIKGMTLTPSSSNRISLPSFSASILEDPNSCFLMPVAARRSEAAGPAPLNIPTIFKPRSILAFACWCGICRSCCGKAHWDFTIQ